MPTPLSGPGVGLPLPQNLYPSLLQNAPQDTPTNRVALAPGDALAIPAGDFYVSPGMYLTLQYNDPVTGLWAMGSSAAYESSPIFVKSDGFNFRIANLTGCIVGLAITSGGNGSYVQASTTISITGSTATAVPIIGGALTLSGGTLTANGAGFGVPPIVFIPSPPPAANNPNGVGGVAASGYCIIASGTVSAFSFTSPGAGYASAPPVFVAPSPYDPNINIGITNASITFTLANAGSLTGALITNPGAPLNNNSLGSITITVSGAGATASVSAVVMQTVVAGSVSGIGTGVGASATSKLTTVGGVPPAGTISGSPDILGLAWRPRPADIGLTANAGGSVTVQTGTIYDGGLFLGTPNPVIIPAGILTAYPTVSLFMGSRPDIAVIQPAP